MTTDYICYCFKHTKKDLEDDAKAHGKSTIMAAIIAHSKAGECHCKENNPKGK